MRLILDMGIRVLCGARRIWNGPDPHRQRSSVVTFFGIAAVIIFPPPNFRFYCPSFSSSNFHHDIDSWNPSSNPLSSCRRDITSLVPTCPIGLQTHPLRRPPLRSEDMTDMLLMKIDMVRCLCSLSQHAIQRTNLDIFRQNSPPPLGLCLSTIQLLWLGLQLTGNHSSLIHITNRTTRTTIKAYSPPMLGLTWTRLCP